MQCRCGGCGEWGHNNTKQKCPDHPDYKTYWANVSKDEDRKQAKKAADDAQAYLKRRYVGNKIKNDLKSRVTSARNGCAILVMNLKMEKDPIPTEIVDEFYRITSIDEYPNKCFWCKKELSSKDIVKEHIIPTCCSKHNIYGTNYIINIAPSCKDCNGKKSSKIGEQLKAFLRERRWDEPNIEQLMTFIEENNKWYMADEPLKKFIEEMCEKISDNLRREAKETEDKFNILFH